MPVTALSEITGERAGPVAVGGREHVAQPAGGDHAVVDERVADAQVHGRSRFEQAAGGVVEAVHGACREPDVAGEVAGIEQAVAAAEEFHRVGIGAGGAERALVGQAVVVAIGQKGDAVCSGDGDRAMVDDRVSGVDAYSPQACRVAGDAAGRSVRYCIVVIDVDAVSAG